MTHFFFYVAVDPGEVAVAGLLLGVVATALLAILVDEAVHNVDRVVEFQLSARFNVLSQRTGCDLGYFWGLGRQECLRLRLTLARVNPILTLTSFSCSAYHLNKVSLDLLSLLGRQKCKNLILDL